MTYRYGLGPSIGAFLMGALLVASSGCGDDDTPANGDAGMFDASSRSDSGGGTDSSFPPIDSSSGDSGVVDGAAADGGDDGSTGDGGDQDGGGDAGLPMGALFNDLCGPATDTQLRLAVSHDGASVAALRCGATDELWVYALADGAGVSLGEVPSSSDISFTLDDGFVLFDDSGSLSLVAADGMSAAFAVADGTVSDYRTFRERVSNTEFAPRVIAMEDTGSTKRVIIRGDDDDYAGSTTLIEDTGLVGDLSNLSASGRTLVATVSDTVTETYVKVRTNAAMSPFTMPFGPEVFGMAPVGLGDTHNFAYAGDRLVRVELDTGTAVELVASGAGLLTDPAQLIEREHAPGVKYAHFIVDGDPARRIRDATEDLEVLSTANAIAQALSPDRSFIVFLSDNAVSSVPAVGGDTVLLMSDIGAASGLAHAFAPDSSEIAVVTAASGLMTSPLDTADSAVVLAADSVLPSSVGYNGDGSQLVWLNDAGELHQSPPGTDTDTLVAGSVAAWWPIPGSAEVLYESEGLVYMTGT